MKIKYSKNGEVSIEGTQEEMGGLSVTIIEFVCSDKKTLSLNLETYYDPSPYDTALSNLKLSKTSGSDVQIKNDTLTFSGSNDFFESIANNLPNGVEATPYHVHYDSISFPEFIKPEAQEIVFVSTQ